MCVGLLNVRSPKQGANCGQPGNIFICTTNIKKNNAIKDNNAMCNVTLCFMHTPRMCSQTVNILCHSKLPAGKFGIPVTVSRDFVSKSVDLSIKASMRVQLRPCMPLVSHQVVP